jgi:3-hydroxyisobutyrate dehydrogenase-like beta-hydroxyacid dehydrogenase
MEQRLAFIGLGAMGAPMARRLAASGYPVAVYDTRSERTVALEDAGCRGAASPAEAARDADVVLLMVVNGAQVHAALFGEDGVVSGVRPGATIIVLSTIGPACIREIDGELAAHRVHLIDAPVSGGVARAAAGELLIMTAGDRAVLAGAEPVLSCLASEMPDCGETVGEAQAVKLVNQLLCGIHIVAAAEALSYAEALGIRRDFALDVVEKGAASSFMLSDRGRRMVSEEFVPPRSSLSIFIKDMALVTETARECVSPVPLASLASQLFATGAALGFDDEDDAGVIRAYPVRAPRKAQLGARSGDPGTKPPTINGTTDALARD